MVSVSRPPLGSDHRGQSRHCVHLSRLAQLDVMYLYTYVHVRITLYMYTSTNNDYVMCCFHLIAVVLEVATSFKTSVITCPFMAMLPNLSPVQTYTTCKYSVYNNN